MRRVLPPESGQCAGHFARIRAAIVVASSACASACSASLPPPEPSIRDERASIAAIDAELTALSRGLTARHPETFRSILEDALASDPYLCRPLPRQVFFGSAAEGTRTIEGVLPHYGFFFGPMHYRVRRRGSGEPPGWEVEVTIALDPTRAPTLELPDCALVKELGADERRCSRCALFERARHVEACPRIGLVLARRRRRPTCARCSAGGRARRSATTTATRSASRSPGALRLHLRRGPRSHAG
jgi:hypothetical protein